MSSSPMLTPHGALVLLLLPSRECQAIELTRWGAAPGKGMGLQADCLVVAMHLLMCWLYLLLWAGCSAMGLQHSLLVAAGCALLGLQLAEALRLLVQSLPHRAVLLRLWLSLCSPALCHGRGVVADCILMLQLEAPTTFEIHIDLLPQALVQACLHRALHQ